MADYRFPDEVIHEITAFAELHGVHITAMEVQPSVYDYLVSLCKTEDDRRTVRIPREEQPKKLVYNATCGAVTITRADD